MEKQLFDWYGWNDQDTAAFTFYNVVLKCDVGPHKAGDKFFSATLDYERGQLSFTRNIGKSLVSAGDYRISLQIGEEITD